MVRLPRVELVTTRDLGNPRHSESTRMIDPFEPAQPEPAPTPAAFSKTIRAPRFLRVGIVVGAAGVVLISAALTLGASPEPSTGGTTQPNASADPGGRGHDFRDGGEGCRFGPLGPFVGRPGGGAPTAGSRGRGAVGGAGWAMGSGAARSPLPPSTARTCR